MVFSLINSEIDKFKRLPPTLNPTFDLVYSSVLELPAVSLNANTKKITYNVFLRWS